MSNVLKHPKIPVDHTTDAAEKPKLLDEVRARIRRLNYSIRTEDTYVDWARRFVLFHGKRHLREMGAAEIEAFLTHLAVVGKVSASTQNQANDQVRQAARQSEPTAAIEAADAVLWKAKEATLGAQFAVAVCVCVCPSQPR